MKDNQGITLVEIIVVIAIIAILAGGAILSTGMISTWQLNNGGKSFETFYSKSRLQAMAKADIGGMIIYQKDGKVTLGMATKEEMNFSAFQINQNEISIPSGIVITLTLEEDGGTGLSQEYILDPLGADRPANPIINAGTLNIGAFNFKKGTGAQIPVTYTITSGGGATGEYHITKIVLGLKGKAIVYRIEPTTGTYTEE